MPTLGGGSRVGALQIFEQRNPNTLLLCELFLLQRKSSAKQLWWHQSARPSGPRQRAEAWWASTLMTTWLVGFSFLRKRVCNFIPIIVSFERFLDDCKKKKKIVGQLNCFYSFFPQITIWCSCSRGWQKRDKMDHLLPPLGVGSGREREKQELSLFLILFLHKCNFSGSLKWWNVSPKCAFLLILIKETSRK